MVLQYQFCPVHKSIHRITAVSTDVENIRSSLYNTQLTFNKLLSKCQIVQKLLTYNKFKQKVGKDTSNFRCHILSWARLSKERFNNIETLIF